ncbi:hypothetical protein [Halomonas korlensis]|uniref:Uncharacterized protein n=1 Tax=Halomonas korlensis TaxID=463301 RepID=A0A1I7HVR8_9GAMM|nr:hypothetical protein [Halomonas korlensis]SFU64814.1 hypothetical protein SAMN04487955_105131 [Halomonas korlensis]
MSSKNREFYELERRKVSEAGRTLREWQERRPFLQKKVDQEEAGQGDLDIVEDLE